MPISAIGNKRVRSDAGFSLVETLTVLMIVGLIVGVVLIAAPGGDRRISLEAERIAARLVAAQDESVIANRTIALVVNRQGYGFERLEENGWAPVEHGSALAFRPWPAGVEAQVEAHEGEWGDARVARFTPIGEATPASLMLSGAGARARVEIAANGGVHVSPID